MSSIVEAYESITAIKPLMNIIVSVMYIAAGFIGTKVASVLIKRASEKRTRKDKKMMTIVNLLTSILRYVIWFIIILAVLNVFSIQTAGILTSAGVLGFAVGFGAQDLVKDFISGFFIIFEQQFNVGDIIAIDGFKGTVVSLGLKTTHIQSWTGEVKIISNGSINNVVNYSFNNSIAVVDFSIAYDTDVEAFTTKLNEQLIGISLEDNPLIKTPQLLGVQKLNDSGLDMRIICETAPQQHFGVERFLRQFVKEFCDSNNYEIPYPQVVIHHDK
jgi:small conductance mechanosensitive channel